MSDSDDRRRSEFFATEEHDKAFVERPPDERVYPPAVQAPRSGSQVELSRTKVLRMAQKSPLLTILTVLLLGGGGGIGIGLSGGEQNRQDKAQVLDDCEADLRRAERFLDRCEEQCEP